jgi:hypothetical protein
MLEAVESTERYLHGVRVAPTRSGRWLRRLWCKMFHRRCTWPLRGVYECLECGLEYKAPYR